MQKKLGNIVDTNENSVYDVMFNKVSSMGEIDPSLPTLIIGMETAMENIKDFSILNRLDGDVWWTFSKRERRGEHSDDIKKFKQRVLTDYLSSVTYEYVNFTCYTLERVKKFIRYIKSSDDKLCFLTKESRFMFIYSKRYNRVWGLSLSLCDYIGVDRKKIVGKIKSNTHNHIMNGVGFFDTDMRDMIGDNTHLILPALAYFGEK